MKLMLTVQCNKLRYLTLVRLVIEALLVVWPINYLILTHQLSHFLFWFLYSNFLEWKWHCIDLQLLLTNYLWKLKLFQKSINIKMRVPVSPNHQASDFDSIKTIFSHLVGYCRFVNSLGLLEKTQMSNA